MKVFEIAVSFKRSVQPKQFEQAGAEVEIRAQLGDDDIDYKRIAAGMMTDARDLVHNAGLRGNSDGPTIHATVIKTVEPASTAGPSGIPDDGATTKPAARPRGRPPKKVEAVNNSGIPDEAQTKPVTDSGIPDETMAKSATDSGIPDERAKAAEDWENAAPAEEKPMDAAGLQAFITKKVKEGKTDVAGVKAILAKHGAQRCGDLKTEDIAKVKVEIDAL